MRFAAEIDRQTLIVEVSDVSGGFRVKIGGEVWEVDARRPAPGTFSLLIGGTSCVADVKEADGWFVVDVDGETYRIRMEEEARHHVRTRGGAPGESQGQVLVAPMPGKVVRVVVQEGQAVKAGEGLVVVEAMKMENEFKATSAGVVREVRAQPGQAVNAGDVLIVIG